MNPPTAASQISGPADPAGAARILITTLRAGLLGCLFLVLGASAQGDDDAKGAKKKKKDREKPARVIPGTTLFATNALTSFSIDIPKAGMDSLRKDPRQAVRSTVTAGTNVYRDVGVHLKGAAGSFRGLDDRPAITLIFDRFTPDQRIDGLRKLHLNNSVQDASYMTEVLCSEIFRAADVPTPRAAHATLQLNGRKLGLYVVKEAFNKDFLGQHFRSRDGNLYDSGFIHDIDEAIELDSGDGVKDRSDLKALAEAAKEPDPALRWEKLQAILDVRRFLRFASLEIIADHWDGYCRNKNNYRVYHDRDSGKFIFFPHGMDQMFGNPGSPMRPPNLAGLVVRGALTTAAGRREYREQTGDILTNVFRLEHLTNRVQELATLLKPYNGDMDNQARRMRGLLTNRWNFVKRWVDTPDARPPVFVDGVASLTNWVVGEPKFGAFQDRVKSSDGRATLHITATNRTGASWRTRLALEPGKYRFEGLARSAGVVQSPVTNAPAKKADPAPAKPGAPAPAAAAAPPANTAAAATPAQPANTAKPVPPTTATPTPTPAAAPTPAAVPPATAENRPAAAPPAAPTANQEKKGIGAGLRTSGIQKPRENQLLGDQPWTRLSYVFEVPVGTGEDTELVCELRAIEGEVWFDVTSLRLHREK